MLHLRNTQEICHFELKQIINKIFLRLLRIFKNTRHTILLDPPRADRNNKFLHHSIIFTQSEDFGNKGQVGFVGFSHFTSHVWLFIAQEMYPVQISTSFPNSGLGTGLLLKLCFKIPPTFSGYATTSRCYPKIKPDRPVYDCLASRYRPQSF
jgi:hypothetical protein